MTLVFWNAGMKALDSGEIDVSEGNAEDTRFLWV